MKHWKCLLIPAMVFSLLSPPMLWAAGEDMEEVTATFQDYQNAVQAERAAYLAGASITYQEVTALENDALNDATTAADAAKEEYANDEADQQVKDISRNHAINTIDKFDGIDGQEYDQRAMDEATKLIDALAIEYAEKMGEKGSEAYRDAYDAAWARATDPSFNNALDTAYKESLAMALEEEEGVFDAWQVAYNKAFQRSTGEGYTNFRTTAYKQALIEFQETHYEDVKGAAYDEALAEKMAVLSGQKSQLVYEMRFKRKWGWGRITRELGLPAKYNGVGQWSKGMPAPEEQVAPPVPEEMSLEEEIAKATHRDTRTGWNKGPGTSAKSKGNSKKWIGLNETSLKAEAAVSDVGAGNGKSSNGKGGSSAGAGQSNNSNKSQTSLSSVSSPSGKEKSNNGNNGRSSNSSKSDKNDRGNSGNNGKNDKNDRGNSGNNGNGKGNK